MGTIPVKTWLQGLTSIGVGALASADLGAVYDSDADAMKKRDPRFQTFVGASVRKSANQTTADYTSSTNITFDEEDYDTDAFHDTGSNTDRLTIPAAYNGYKVMVWGTVQTADVTADNSANVAIRHFNSSDVQQRAWSSAAESVYAVRNPVSTPGPVVVATGDYFVLELLIESDNSITVNTNTSFAIQVIGP